MGLMGLDGETKWQKFKKNFRNFTLDPFTVDWNNEIGFAPESLYERGIAVA